MNNFNSWKIWLSVFGILIVSLFAIGSLTNNSPDLTANVLDAVAAPQDWAKGSKDARAILVEYGDYQCPACALYNPLVKRLTEEFGDQLLFVYKHFPLIAIHKNAVLAAKAAEAAGAQGKFWEMHELLYGNQKFWEGMSTAQDAFGRYAAELGLDTTKFFDDLYSKAAQDKVSKDLESAQKAGLNSTPTFFLNGVKIRNPRSYEEFRLLIQAQIDQS